MQENTTATVTMTAACELGTHRCKGVVLSLTGESWDAQKPCQCPCHNVVQDLPDAWKAMAVLTPPCDDDVVLDDDELDELLDREADRQLEQDAELRMFGVAL
jgi:hypothetical protein